MKNPASFDAGFVLVVIAAGFEPATVCLEGRCSIQLSYATGCHKRDANVQSFGIFKRQIFCPLPLNFE